MLKELRSIRKEIRLLNGNARPAAKPLPVRQIEDKIYSADVLKKLKISVATLIKYEKMGLIKFHKEGRSKVYSLAEILDFKKKMGGRKRISKDFLATE